MRAGSWSVWSQSIRRSVAVVGLVASMATAQNEVFAWPDDESGRLGDLISLVSSDPRLSGPLDEAIAVWRACPQFGVGFPRIETVPSPSPSDLREGEPHRRVVSIELSNRMGRFSRCGTFRGASIVLYRETLDARGRRLYCGDVAQNLAHEIGHALGIHHDAAELDLAEEHTEVMSMIRPNHRTARSVLSAECTAVDQHWMTSFELAARE